MKFLHTADWHLGKKLHGYDLLEDQKKALEDLLKTALREKVDALVIAGDLYDRKIPNAQTVALLNDFLYQVNIRHRLPILAISGNHDSSTRLNTGSPWFEKENFFMRTSVKESIIPIEIKDTQFYLLPYFELYDIEIAFGLEDFSSLQEAFFWLLEEMKKSFKKDKKHVLVAHFFAAGATTTDSETKLQVGGLQAFPIDKLEIFDYVALGHLHNPKAIKHPFISYSGSLLPYSLSEEGQVKGNILVETKEMSQKRIPLTPSRKILRLTGSFEELTDSELVAKHQNDFVGLHLTDTKVIPDLMQTFRTFYPNILELTRKRPDFLMKETKEIETKSPQDLMADFFEEMTGNPLTKNQLTILQQTFAQVEKGAE